MCSYSNAQDLEELRSKVVSEVDIGDSSYYYLIKCHGDIANLTNEVGSVANTYECDAFGNVIS